VLHHHGDAIDAAELAISTLKHARKIAVARRALAAALAMKELRQLLRARQALVCAGRAQRRRAAA
jgi:hypothetical protein